MISIRILCIALFFILKLSSQSELPLYLSNAVNIYNVDKSIASGITYEDDSSMYLITAAHVLFHISAEGSILDSVKMNEIKLRMYSPNQKESKGAFLRIGIDGLKRIEKHPEKDICVLKLGDKASEESRDIRLLPDVYAEKNNGVITSFNPTQIMSIEELLIGEEIRIIGYPTYLDTKKSGQFTYDYDYPLVQDGIISGISDESLGNIIISGAVYYGNSGGAVLNWEKKLIVEGNEITLLNSISLIGIVSSFIPFNYPKSKPLRTKYDVDVSNSGYSVVVPIKYALELIEVIKN